MISYHFVSIPHSEEVYMLAVKIRFWNSLFIYIRYIAFIGCPRAIKRSLLQIGGRPDILRSIIVIGVTVP